MLRPLLPWRYVSVAAVAILAVLSVSLALAAPPPAWRASQQGIGYDPLTPQEIAEAAAAAGVQPLLAAAALRDEVTPGEPPPSLQEEVLLIERSLHAKIEGAAGDWPRQADVFTYRYRDDVLVHTVYDYDTDTVETVEEIQGFQLPLTSYERELATMLALQDGDFRAYLEEASAALDGGQLTAASVASGALETRVFVYYAGAAPEIEPAGMEQCGVQRCAQIMFVATGATVLDVLPLVNLSTGTVAFVAPIAERAAGDHRQEDAAVQP